MTQDTREQLPPNWKIQSTYVKTRDGPYRLEQVYRLLLEPMDGHRPGDSPLRDEQIHVRQQGGA